MKNTQPSNPNDTPRSGDTLRVRKTAVYERLESLPQEVTRLLASAESAGKSIGQEIQKRKGTGYHRDVKSRGFGILSTTAAYEPSGSTGRRYTVEDRNSAAQILIDPRFNKATTYLAASLIPQEGGYKKGQSVFDSLDRVDKGLSVTVFAHAASHDKTEGVVVQVSRPFSGEERIEDSREQSLTGEDLAAIAELAVGIEDITAKYNPGHSTGPAEMFTREFLDGRSS